VIGVGDGASRFSPAQPVDGAAFIVYIWMCALLVTRARAGFMEKPATPALDVKSADAFLRTVLRSGLLDRATLQTELRAVPLDQRGDAEALAEQLIKIGKLTRFQAVKLLTGASIGLVLGPFQILAPIAKGGMGTVYLAHDTRSEQMVALKVLPPRRAREEERVLARFRREMEMSQRVSHPHIAWTCEVGLCQGVYYIAMEYIPGRSLFRVVADDGPLPVPRAARLFSEVAAALDHAHTRGLIHRDLKPANIIITPNDHAKLLDFGLALMEGEEARRDIIGGAGYVVGTMDYIAPEQADNAATVDGRSDLYALGSTLYYALTGRPPFPGGTTSEKLNKHRNEDPEPVPQFNANVPPGFIGLLRRLMAKNPDKRPSSAAAVREELLNWAGSGLILPLDTPHDPGYEHAVELLEAAEPSSETSDEVVPVLEMEPVGKVVLVEEVFPIAQGESVSAPPARMGRRKQERQGEDDDKPKTSTGPLSPWVGVVIFLLLVLLTLIGLGLFMIWYLWLT
jgi:serine/threonine protein kinase